MDRDGFLNTHRILGRNPLHAKPLALQLRVFTLTLILLGLIAQLIFAVLSWQQEKADLEADLASQTAFAASAVEHFFGDLGSSLGLLGESLQGQVWPSDPQRARALLQGFQAHHPEVASMVLFDATGRMRINTGLPVDAILPDLRQHPEILKALIQDMQSSAPYVIGRTQHGLVLDHWRIPVRHTVWQAGRPEFLLQASVRVERANLWQGLPLQKDLRLGILRDDGFQQYRWPDHDPESTHGLEAQDPLRQHLEKSLKQGSGVFESQLPEDGVDRLGAYMHVPELGLTVYLSLPKSLLWSRWWTRNALALLGFVLYSGLFLGMSRMILRREEQHSHSLLSQARRDALTGLPNRLAAHERLDQEIADRQAGGQFALLFLDLDGFKEINDNLGHAMGDRLLKQVATRLQQDLRRQETLARLGGDEFLIIQPGAGVREAARLARQMLDLLNPPFLLAEHRLQVGASIGISLYPQDGLDAGLLLKHADLAMYEAKRQGRNDFAHFSPLLEQRSRERLQLRQDLERALENGEFLLHYQPLVDMQTGRIIGAEALIRWQDPQKGLRSPAEFIPFAEESGLILPIGEWVMEEAFRQAQRWASQGLDLRVSINLSTRQFQSPSLILKLESLLQECPLARRHLELEITESAAMLDPRASIRTMNLLKSLNLRIAIDDFGTGYSSLSYLKHVPADVIKIDQSFVRDLIDDPDDAAIVRTIIALARCLGCECLAEGIETAEHFEALREMGCDYGQGYWMSRPLALPAFEELLQRNPCFMPADQNPLAGLSALLPRPG
ncbi:putative bifunctional diguanylate cyclase/phosphodiesterase [Thermithiobacillus plumbiphilus]|uniref:EAL domain-containing protein n=1 Tax=Thermithiobacillus plumbiphilus TaxID=1729899 RepID=A0ABU9DBZ0_9PROT